VSAAAEAPVWPARVETVLLDAGGVLIDLDYAYLKRLIESCQDGVSEVELSRAEALARHEINSAVQAGGRVGGLWRDYFHVLLAKVGIASEQHDALIDSLWEAHQRVGLWTVACDGAVAAVSELRRRGLRIGVVSNAEGRVARDLDDAGYRGAFETVVDSHLVGVEKPDPAIFAIALERMSVRAESAIFVGDLPDVDVKGALAAGIAPVLLDRHDLYPDAPARRIRALSDLPDLVAS
jgi:putative hydrolase of the HAD superfamily